jgi:sialic acid synthase SpsE
MSSNTTIRIGNDDLFFDVGPNQKPFIIAELSGNHGQSLTLAKQMVEEAARSGAHALLSYKPTQLKV